MDSCDIARLVARAARNAPADANVDIMVLTVDQACIVMRPNVHLLHQLEAYTPTTTSLDAISHMLPALINA